MCLRDKRTTLKTAGADEKSFWKKSRRSLWAVVASTCCNVFSHLTPQERFTNSGHYSQTFLVICFGLNSYKFYHFLDKFDAYLLYTFV